MVVRTDSSPLNLAAPIRREVEELDKAVPVSGVATMQERLSQTLAKRRFSMVLLSVFAFLALTLAAVGIFGVISYSAAQRTHEIGIRMALGAQRGDVIRLVIGQGLVLVSIGVGIGIAAAVGLTRLMASLLYGVRPTDPLTFITVSIFLLAVALIASCIPARRAARVDPMVALRHE